MKRGRFWGFPFTSKEQQPFHYGDAVMLRIKSVSSHYPGQNTARINVLRIRQANLNGLFKGG